MSYVGIGTSKAVPKSAFYAVLLYIQRSEIARKSAVFYFERECKYCSKFV